METEDGVEHALSSFNNEGFLLLEKMYCPSS